MPYIFIFYIYVRRILKYISGEACGVVSPPKPAGGRLLKGMVNICNIEVATDYDTPSQQEMLPFFCKLKSGLRF